MIGTYTFLPQAFTVHSSSQLPFVGCFNTFVFTTENFEQLNTSENAVDDNKNKFTSELEREDKVEFFDL